MYLACNCNSAGSLEENCNQTTGQCLCAENVTGRTCNKCRVGYWGLQTQNQCMKCDCCVNGTVASQCDSVSDYSYILRCEIRYAFSFFLHEIALSII